MKRKIIKIDASLCNGCGQCITSCAEGALKLVDGKARLVKDSFCDGFGDCIGECPTGALTIVERESDAFDARAVEDHLLKTSGEDAVTAMRAAAARHAPGPTTTPSGPPAGGCPGSRMRAVAPTARPPAAAGGPGTVIPSELTQWPVQLHLVQPGAPFFSNRELVVVSTCSPTASADVHWRFIRGRAIVVACPKLDRTEGYVEKLAGILADPTIPKVIVLRMEVPCCGGLTRIVEQAVARSGRSDLIVEETIVSVDGALQKPTPQSEECAGRP